MNDLQQIAHFFSQLKCTEGPFYGKDLPLKFAPMGKEDIFIQADYPCDFLEKHLANALKTKFPSYKFHWKMQIIPHLTQLPGLGIKNIKNAIAIVSGKGGVGKSTVATNLACSIAKMGAKTGLLDADIYGPSLPTMMNIDKDVQINESNRYIPIENYGVECMSMGFLQKDGPLIWRGPMLAKALMQMIDGTNFSELDYLFIDMPPGTGDIPLSLVQKIPLSGAIIVTTPQTIATLDAEKALQMFIRTNVPILGIIANMAWHECGHCHEKSYLFGEHGAKALASKYQVPLLSEIPLDDSIRFQGDNGKPVVLCDAPVNHYWQTAATNMLLCLAKRPPNIDSKIPPIRST